MHRAIPKWEGSAICYSCLQQMVRKLWPNADDTSSCLKEIPFSVQSFFAAMASYKKERGIHNDLQ